MNERQLVLFKLNDEEYGIDIMQVKEIGPYTEPVKIPNSPEFIEGIVNLRGVIIPIINLKKRFNVPYGAINDQTRIIVLNLDERQVGFIVDDASEVLTLNAENIDAAPEIICDKERQYIAGVGKVENRIFLLLDLNKLFAQNENEQLKLI